jgi:hypothetical protein
MPFVTVSMKIGSLRIAADAGLLNAGEYDPSKEALPVIVLTSYLLRSSRSSMARTEDTHAPVNNLSASA